MRPSRILVLLHKNLIPPQNATQEMASKANCLWTTEYDVLQTLPKLGHQIYPIGIESDLEVLEKAIKDIKPHIVFNLIEMFDGQILLDQNIVSYLELIRIPYTGCNPRGLILARDKGLSKKILLHHEIPTPKFTTFKKNKPIKVIDTLKYPLIVKCLREEASFGIGKASIVSRADKLTERIEFIHQKLNDHAIAEEFIEGREFFVGLLGHERLECLPIRELVYKKSDHPEKEFYSSRAKFNDEYRKNKGIKTITAQLDSKIEQKIIDLCKKAFHALQLSGYARMDLRMDKQGHIYLLEANPNPDLCSTEELAKSAQKLGMNYAQLLEKIMTLALSWHQKEH